MAEGVLSAAKMIMGDCEEIQALGLDHYESPTEIARRIERQVTAEPDCDFMIFCDIHGGSVHTTVQETGVAITSDVLFQAGIAAAKKTYAMTRAFAVLR